MTAADVMATALSWFHRGSPPRNAERYLREVSEAWSAADQRQARELADLRAQLIEVRRERDRAEIRLARLQRWLDAFEAPAVPMADEP